MPQSDDQDALYLFCLGRPTMSETLADEPELETHTLHDQIAALIEYIDPDPWTGETGDAHLEDLQWVAPRAVRHETIIEAAMEASPVYPLPFGTLFSGLESLTSKVCEHDEVIEDFLCRMADRREWGIKGWMDRETLRTHILDDATSDPADTESPGQAYLQQQKERQDRDQHLESWLDEYASTFVERLESHVPSVVEAGLRRAEERTDDRELAYNWAALAAPDDELEALRGAIESLNREYAERGLTFDLSGPWPPYNFRPRSPHREAGSLSFDRI